MGSTFQTVVGLDATAEDAVAHGERVTAWLVAEGIVEPSKLLPGPRWEAATGERDPYPGAWLTVVTSRTVFVSPQKGGVPVCPHCASEYADTHRAVFSPAMDTWWTTGRADIPCPACGRAVPLCEWRWPEDGFAFAYLGFDFRDAPPLLPEFVAELNRVIGQRTRFVRGKW
ncbi:hypothetical protein [Streptomyces sp. NPDC056144]|uniref:hypothetical protein n=1 Tax=unclassified Streptomyces TaxID=2593676 RepID=UPI0035DE4214